MDHLIQCAFPTPDRGPLTISVLSTAGDDVDVVKITTERSPPAYRIGLIKVYQGAVVQVLNLHSRSMIALPPRERDTCEEQKAPEEPPKGGIAIKHGEVSDGGSVVLSSDFGKTAGGDDGHDPLRGMELLILFC